MNRRNFLLGLTASPLVTYNLWIALKIKLSKPFLYKFECITSAQNKGKSNILIIGDSRVSRWKPLPSIEGYNFINRGVGGEKLNALIERLDLELNCYKPICLILQVGVNDVVAATLKLSDNTQSDVNDIIENFEKIVSRCESLGIKCILTSIIKPSLASGFYCVQGVNEMNVLIKDINIKIKKFCQNEVVDFLDFSTELESSNVGMTDAKFRVDTLHINEAAYKKLNALIVRSKVFQN